MLNMNDLSARCRSARAQMPEPVPSPEYPPMQEPPAPDLPPMEDPMPGEDVPMPPIPDRFAGRSDAIDAFQTQLQAGGPRRLPLMWLLSEVTDEIGRADPVDGGFGVGRLESRLTLWPGGKDRPLAWARTHGLPVEWLPGGPNDG